VPGCVAPWLERGLCREVQVNLAYRWFCGLSIEDKVPDHSASVYPTG
jgi:transposase